jgi:hypothetical protein
MTKFRDYPTWQGCLAYLGLIPGVLINSSPRMKSRFQQHFGLPVIVSTCANEQIDIDITWSDITQPGLIQYVDPEIFGAHCDVKVS